jgi:phenylacetate-CoA ligase
MPEFTAPLAVPRSALSGNLWPAVPHANGALSLALQFQLSQSERWPPAVLRERQLAQIGLVADHAFRTAPFWHDHLERAGYRAGMAITPQWFAALPVVGRTAAQAAGAAFFSNAVPPAHGPVQSSPTSGSTGTPMECRWTALETLLRGAATLRDSLWHGRDLAGKLALIRVGFEPTRQPSWGTPAYDAFQTGPAVTFDAREDIARQVEWLLAEQPQYLMSHASNLRALAAAFVERGLRLDSLREVKSFSEVLPADLRELVDTAWGAKLTDMYSSNEVGALALQCPQAAYYHVQSEFLLVEVLNAAGTACAPGEIGRVVVSALHNFAMPLLRYDLGDHAEAGAPCACGRGLPVLNRIMGRTRNMLRLPDGGSFWPGFPLNALTTIAPIRQFRLIQHSLSELEMQLVLARPLTDDEATALRAALLTRLRHPFDIRLVPVARIDGGANHKFEDFVCRMT